MKLKFILCIVCLLSFLFISETIFAQGLSLDVYPSEDELLEAFLSGEIDYEQYLLIQEIQLFGVDSSHSYLLHQIPNLGLSQRYFQGRTTSREADQETGFVAPVVPGTGKLAYRYSEQLNENETGRYRFSGFVNLSEHWQAKGQLYKEYSGVERVTFRSFEYHDTRSVHTVKIGNFIEQFGLGSIIGYRGKLFQYSDKLDDESILFPDFGGFNGLYIAALADDVASEAMISYNRGAEHTLLTFGTIASRKINDLTTGLQFGLNHLADRRVGHNRQTATAFNNSKLGLTGHFDYPSGYTALELTGQAGSINDRGGYVTDGAALVEGIHQNERIQFQYAGWFYGDRWQDLSGGGRSAPLRHTTTLDSVDFEFSDKRKDQKGALLKGIVSPSENYQIISSLHGAGYNADTSLTQIGLGLIRKLNPDFSLRVDYLGTMRTGQTLTDDEESFVQTFQIESRWGHPRWSVRQRVSYRSNNAKQTVGLFAHVRYMPAPALTFDLWTNFSSIDEVGIQRANGYFRSEFSLFNSLRAALKLGHTYASNSVKKNQGVATFELTATL
ncbi:MAG: hypothetical protein SGI97_11310 [candidate division Zixibacteria bacterium]|nr:hypothetical protein [candidate division Zixibacteria bacterium]